MIIYAKSVWLLTVQLLEMMILIRIGMATEGEMKLSLYSRCWVMMAALPLPSTRRFHFNSDPINTPGKQAPVTVTGSVLLRLPMKWSCTFYLCIMVGKSTWQNTGHLINSLSRAHTVQQLSGGEDKTQDITGKPKANYPDMDETIANWTNDIIWVI